MKYEDEHGVNNDNVYEADEAPIEKTRSRASRLVGSKRKKNVALITNATVSPEQNLHKREVQYNWLQGSRIPLLMGSAVAWWMGYIWVAVILFIISVPMPWIAVVIGNAHGEPRDPRAPMVYKPQLQRDFDTQWQLEHPDTHALGPGASSGDGGSDGKAIDLVREQYRFVERPTTPPRPSFTDDEASGITYKKSGGMFS